MNIKLRKVNSPLREGVRKNNVRAFISLSSEAQYLADVVFPAEGGGDISAFLY